MRWTPGSTPSPGDPSVAVTTPNLDLLDDRAQAGVLADLVAVLDDGEAVQVRHARHPLTADTRGRSAEAVLVRELAATAHVWRTELHARPGEQETLDCTVD